MAFPVPLFLTNRLLQNLNLRRQIVRFQNGSNKVAIELNVVQFWSEIIRVISNQTHRPARSFDFEITRMISDQIEVLHGSHVVWQEQLKCFALERTSFPIGKRLFCSCHAKPLLHSTKFNYHC